MTRRRRSAASGALAAISAHCSPLRSRAPRSGCVTVCAPSSAASRSPRSSSSLAVREGAMGRQRTGGGLASHALRQCTFSARRRRARRSRQRSRYSARRPATRAATGAAGRRATARGFRDRRQERGRVARARPTRTRLRCRAPRWRRTPFAWTSYRLSIGAASVEVVGVTVVERDRQRRRLEPPAASSVDEPASSETAGALAGPPSAPRSGRGDRQVPGIDARLRDAVIHEDDRPGRRGGSIAASRSDPGHLSAPPCDARTATITGYAGRAASSSPSLELLGREARAGRRWPPRRCRSPRSRRPRPEDGSPNSRRAETA